MSNSYLRLLALIPTTPRQVGEVTGISGPRVHVDIVGGGVRICQGDARVGDMVYVEADRIVGQAPSLPYQKIEV